MSVELLDLGVLLGGGEITETSGFLLTVITFHRGSK